MKAPGFFQAPSFFQGVVIAFGFSLAGSIGFAGLSPLIGPASALRTVMGLLALAYVIYLIGSSSERSGRWVTLIAWSTGALALGWAQWPLSLYALAHVGAIWLVRSVFLHPGFLAAVADLALSLAALAAGVWATAHSGSFFLALWSFFLVQACFVFLPNRRRSVNPDEDRFQQAHRLAEAALSRLSFKA